jgi:hypothetical protein
MSFKIKEKASDASSTNSGGRQAGGQDLNWYVGNANTHDSKFEISERRCRYANSQLGTPSAAKSLGLFWSHGVGDFAHRSIHLPAPEVLTR